LCDFSKPDQPDATITASACRQIRIACEQASPALLYTASRSLLIASFLLLNASRSLLIASVLKYDNLKSTYETDQSTCLITKVDLRKEGSRMTIIRSLPVLSASRKKAV
jgi:hypothetical protein